MDRSGTAPPYLRIVSEIKRRVEAGELRAGDRVPSTRQVAEQWGVARATAAKALNTLRQEGVVVAVSRVGTVVAEPVPRSFPPAGAPSAPPRKERRQPAPSAAHDGKRERMVRTAIAIADAQGFDAVSIRSVATALGIPTMSLYGHVRGKEELAALMADTAFGELELPATPPAGWRTRLELAARLQWRLYLRHPWLPRLVSLTHPQPTPNMLRYGDWGMGVVRELGLDPDTGRFVWWAVTNYVRGTATNLEPQTESERHTGLSTGEWYSAHMPRFRAGLPSSALPAHVAPAGDQSAFDLGGFFESGLQLLLDGVAVLIGRQRLP
ncbi:GntR family transcriptional regulator [Nonomuraea sp. NPDC050680]|uniref:GntR family transcriptional regulator n=1 Tax=Nonomuraea sp. NPDC050680 TaxID=3154630 RepID=UPI0033EBD3A2